MKKRLFIALLACIMCFSFISCGGNESQLQSGQSNSSSQGGQSNSTSQGGEDGSYDLEDYDNENDEQWWNGYVPPEDTEPPQKENSTLEGETIPY